MDFGWLFFNKIQVNNASREGARYAAIHWKEADYVANTENLVMACAPGSVVTVDGSSSVEVTISVKKDVNVLTGVTSTIIGDSVELTASCTMRKE